MNLENELINLKVRAEAAVEVVPMLERAALLEQIRELDALVTQIFQRRTGREQASLRAKQHAEIYPQAQAASQKVKKLLQDLKNAQSRLDTAFSAVELRENDVQTVRRAQPKLVDFPSDAEIQNWTAALAAAETRLANSQAARRAAGAERDDIATQLAEAREEFARLERQERFLRPAPAAGAENSRWQVQKLSA